MNKALPKRTHARLKCYDYATPGVYFITICARDRKCVFSKIVTDENEQVANDYTEFGKIAERNLLALEQRFINLRIDKYVIMPNHIHALFVLTDCDSEAAGASPRPTIGTSPCPTIGASSRPTIGASPCPTIGASPCPTIGASPRPTIGASPCPTIGASPRPTIGASPCPTIGASPCTTIGASPRPTIGASPCPTIGASPRTTISDIVCAFKSLTAKECRKISPTAKLFQTSFYDHIVRTELDYADVVLYIENNPLAWQLDELYEKQGEV